MTALTIATGTATISPRVQPAKGKTSGSKINPRHVALQRSSCKERKLEGMALLPCRHSRGGAALGCARKPGLRNGEILVRGALK